MDAVNAKTVPQRAIFCVNPERVKYMTVAPASVNPDAIIP